MTDEAEPTPPASPWNWTKNEGTIALISVVISTIGVLIAAISTVLTYQQIAETNRERMTPYRTVFYTAKLDAYRQITGQAEIYKRAALSADGANTLTESKLRTSDFESYFGFSVEDNKTALAEADKLRDIIAQNKVVWPTEVIDVLDQVDTALYVAIQCPMAVKDRMGVTDQRIITETTCKVDSLVSVRKNFAQALLLAQNMMRKDIQADQFQAIDEGGRD